MFGGVSLAHALEMGEAFLQAHRVELAAGGFAPLARFGDGSKGFGLGFH